MRVPSDQPRDLLSCALAVFGMGGLIFVAQAELADRFAEGRWHAARLPAASR
jgi:hypothetical protein